jgi:hypothetical protein
MRVFVVASRIRIDPFGDPARDLPVGGVSLTEWQNALFRRFGLVRVDVGDLSEVPSGEPRLVLHDNLFFTRRVLKSFLQRWDGKSAAELALPAGSSFIRLFSDLQDFRRDPEGKHACFNLFAFPAGAPTDPATARPLEVVYRERMLELTMPRQVTGIERWEHPVTSSVAFHVRHWLHVLQANLLSIQVRWVDQVVTRPLWTAGVVLRALLPIPGRGGMVARIGRVANRIGRGAVIHPTAVVEGSFIGEGVRIGPRAMVRGSWIGKDVTIEQGADVSYSVIGAKSFVSKHSILYAVASMEESDLCIKGMQMCLVGRRVALTARATPIDVFPGHKLRVKDGDRYVEIAVPLLGSCYGHGSFIGADVYIGPGRAIPNGVRIAPAPERVLSRLPEHLEPGKAYVVRGGTLEEP